jgi:hypothetical protein
VSSALAHVLTDEEPPQRAHVTTHAILAYLARVDAEDPHPQAAIKRAWRRADPAPEHPGARRTEHLYLVYDVRGDTSHVLTVYPVDRGGGS